MTNTRTISTTRTERIITTLLYGAAIAVLACGLLIASGWRLASAQYGPSYFNCPAGTHYEYLGDFCIFGSCSPIEGCFPDRTCEEIGLEGGPWPFCTNPTPPPTTCATQGQLCTSAANACGMTSTGTIGADASCTCSATPPADALCPAPPPPTTCADVGLLGSPYPSGCYAPPPPPPPPATCPVEGQVCTSAANACGMTNTGTYGSNPICPCSATPPADSLCPVPPPPPSPGVCTDAGPITLAATPSRVRESQPTSITFTATAGNTTAACTLTGPGVNHTFPQNPATCSASGTFTATLTLAQQSTYTLTCPGGQTTTTILNIIPKYQEF